MTANCADCGKEVEDARSGLFNGKCWDCAMGHNTPIGTVERLQLAINTIKCYPQCQFKVGQDGYAALRVLEEHVSRLREIVQPRLEFVDLQPGAIFQFSDHGKFPSTYAENLWLKLAVPVNPGNNGVEMSTGKIGYFGPNTFVRIAGVPQ